MDVIEGVCGSFGTYFPDANLVPCSRHFSGNVKTSAGGSKAKAEYYEGLKAPTKHALHKVWARWRASPDAAKMVAYFDARATPNNQKIHLFPATPEIRGMHDQQTQVSKLCDLYKKRKM